MKHNKTFFESIEISNQLIHDIMFMCETRLKPTYFTRSTNCKMDFKNLILFELNFIKKTVQLELDEFFKKIKGADAGITKQAYSEARQKISPIAFIKLADAIISWFYDDDTFKTFKGYRLCAIDGSVLEINNSERLREAFGYAANKTKKFARAMASGIYDIENDMMLTTKITRYGTQERIIAIEMLEKLKELGLKNDLFLFDRGYPSGNLISYLEENHMKYLMRVSKTFFKVVNEAKQPDQIVDVKHEGKIVKIRVLRVILNSGEEEILITNVLDESLLVEDFKELYFKRWGIEVKYNELKNKLQIENFTGDTAIAVEQDFYASIYLSNMVALAKRDANQTIKDENEKKELKYEYKVNTNILIGKLKNSLILMLLEDNKYKRKKKFDQIMQEITRRVIPVRSGRSNARDMSIKTNRYSLNQKPCL